ncbi:thiamine pyrophosphate-requiring protein [Arthrobacter caoxuetaonis]|uniref:Thiamine pyrophosphate-requiring protein n=1 Tax=Arthrobacter caoxuetaonis TaxID=2886935 RepID=A0A9X1ME76_9MICC|nr:thiamine pyrophosphate-requiring protein [Arthrobacter caoxuetaonis]MCC3297961.1 thiamine pyrophosphate-requiring protein [Arthrobacter caoxuetaonis]USQ56975.1 thiamine pyrophosphate-requiring protein [Arthrobacter caoxuetaonis]
MGERLVADVIVDRLQAWGVQRIFGYSGDGINTVLGALRRAGAPRFVQVRHEENAAFMAVGHAKYTGGVGVMLSTQGPGAVHLLNGLYDAKMDSVPVVAIIGQQSRTVLGSAYMQEIDLLNLTRDVASSFRQQVNSPEQIPLVLDRAFKSALADRGPAVVIIPHDVQQAPAPELEHEHGIITTAPVWSPPNLVPGQADLEAAAAVINDGARVAFLVGQGAREAWPQVKALAEKIGAGITTSLMGKPYVDESHPLAAGVMGHLGTSASGVVMGECDTLLIVGSNDPWTEFYPPPGAARAVQIDIDAAAIGNRYPVEAAVTGEAAASLESLLPLVEPRPESAWRTRVEGAVQDWHRLAAERAGTPARPVNPELAVRELSGRLPGNAQVAVDVGSVVYWYARQLRLPAGVPAHLSSTLASMGCSIPYGLAAKLADPERPVIALSGDGAMQMAGVAELITVSRLWPDWADPRFVVMVLNNGELAEVTWEQREMEGDPRFDQSQALPDFSYARYAELLGLQGIRVDDPAKIGAAWDAALDADRPVLIEVMSDPDVPLLPPFPGGKEQGQSMMDALVKEGPATQHARELLETYLGQEEDLVP